MWGLPWRYLDEVHLVFECAALQMLRDDMPTLFQGVHSMRCFVWQDNMVLMSRSRVML